MTTTNEITLTQTISESDFHTTKQENKKEANTAKEVSMLTISSPAIYALVIFALAVVLKRASPTANHQ
jgi:hypothetical protein